MFEEDIQEENNSGLLDISEPLMEVNEPDEHEDYDLDDNLFEDEQSEPTAEIKKNNKRLSKLGSKGIVKMLDLGNANLARKISFSESALEYRADTEALEDLTEVIEEIIPTKPGKDLNIPLWLQLLIFTLLAFLPTLFAAWSDRDENRAKKENKKLKKERKKLKKQIENSKLKAKLKLEKAIAEKPTEKEKMQVLTKKED